MPKDLSLYRPNAGVIIVNDHGEVLAFKRAGASEGTWQLPQGGIDPGEEAFDCAVRELFEETAIEAASELEFIAEHPSWLVYDWPKDKIPKPGKEQYIGQCQKWFLFKFKGNFDAIDLNKAQDKEFEDFKWMKISDVIEATHPMRIKVYCKLVAHFNEYLK